MPGLASNGRTHLHLIDTVLFKNVGHSLIHKGAGRQQLFFQTRLQNWIRQHTAQNPLAQRFDNIGAFNTLVSHWQHGIIHTLPILGMAGSAMAAFPGATLVVDMPRVGLARSTDTASVAGGVPATTSTSAAGRERSNRRAVSRRLTILPNALCVAGAFFFGFTSLVVAVICNLTTFGTYRQSLQTLTRERRRRGIRSQIVLGRSKR